MRDASESAVGVRVKALDEATVLRLVPHFAQFMACRGDDGVICEGDCQCKAYARKALSTLEPVLSGGPGGEVPDEMARTALSEFYHGDCQWNPDLVSEMRAALTAALHRQGGAAVEAALEVANARIAELEAKLRGCHWYWPEHDTSSEMCGESAQEIVQNAYDWTPEEAGDVVAVARGGIVEVIYCASLPPDDDADSDDDFWVEEQTHEAAKTKIEAERVRRAALAGGPRHG